MPQGREDVAWLELQEERGREMKSLWAQNQEDGACEPWLGRPTSPHGCSTTLYSPSKACP